MNKCRELEHPSRRRQSKGHTAFPPYDSHHLAMRNRVRRGQVDGPAEVVPVNQPLNGMAKISFVNPGNELAPARNGASESPSREPSQDPVSATLTRCEDHCRAHRYLPRTRGGRLLEGLFPGACYFDGQFILSLPGCAYFASGLVHLPIECVFVNGGCAGVQPDWRRGVAASDCVAQHSRR